MQIDKAYLDLWAESLFVQNRMLLQVASATCNMNAPVDVITTLQGARRINSRTLNSIISAGARNPLQTSPVEKSRLDEWQTYNATGSNALILGPVPPTLLNSPANKAFLAALRAAQRAGRLVDEERGGWAEGWSDILASFVAIVHMETEGARDER